MNKPAVDRPARPEEVALFRTVADLGPTLWEDVERRSPEEVARTAGVRHDPERGFLIPFLGGYYLVDMAGRAITGPPGHRPAGFQKGLVLLSYLAHAQDLGLSGKMVTGRELNGGAMFFTGPHTLLTAPVTEKFGFDPDAFLKKAEHLGLDRDHQLSGFACRGPVLPHLAVGAILHPADEEFSAELTYIFDSYAHYHLPLDAIWAMINVLAEELAA